MTSKIELERLDAKYKVLAGDISPADDRRSFDFFARVAKSQVAAETASIFIYDPATDKVWLKASTGLAERDIEVPKEGSFVGKVIESKRRLIVNNADKMDGAHKKTDAATGFVTRNVACVPVHVVARDEVVGVVQVLNKTDGGGFTDEDALFLEEVAYMVQIQVDRAFLTQKVCEAAERAESRRKRAVNIAIAAGLIPIALVIVITLMLFGSTLFG